MKNKYLLGTSVGILLLLLSVVFSMVLGMVFPGLNAEYMTPAFRPWTDPLMLLFYLYPLVLGALLSWVWLKTRKAWGSGLDFGLAMGVLSAVPAFIVNFTSFTFSLLMVLTWALMGFVNCLAAGVALEKLEK